MRPPRLRQTNKIVRQDCAHALTGETDLNSLFRYRDASALDEVHTPRRSMQLERHRTFSLYMHGGSVGLPRIPRILGLGLLKDRRKGSLATL